MFFLVIEGNDSSYLQFKEGLIKKINKFSIAKVNAYLCQKHGNNPFLIFQVCLLACSTAHARLLNQNLRMFCLQTQMVQVYTFPSPNISTYIHPCFCTIGLQAVNYSAKFTTNLTLYIPIKVNIFCERLILYIMRLIYTASCMFVI